jgi:membrane-associated phospholipid phosphatase
LKIGKILTFKIILYDMRKYLVFLLITVLPTLPFFAQNIDYQTLKNIEIRRTPIDTRANKFVTNTAPYLSVGGPILMFGIGYFGKNEDLKKRSVEIGLSVAATVVETYALKEIINRPRPYVTHPDLHPLSNESSKSFPSGHTSAAFALATSLSINYPKWYVAVPAFAWASAVGYSRLYVGVHYPSDVLAGATLGAGTAWLTWYLNKKLLGKKGKNKASR